MRNFFIFLVFVFMLFVIAPLAVANVGVGVGLGRMDLSAMKPGGTYNLPFFPVLNTGDEPSNYGVSVDYHEKDKDHPQMWPAREWFKFEPAEFSLNPGQSQNVLVTLSIPIKTTPGDYFAYLEAHPVAKNIASTSDNGSVTIGIAAATKVYLTVSPSNIFQGIYYKIAFFITRNAPWTYIFFAVLIAVILIFLFRKYFKFNVSIGKK